MKSPLRISNHAVLVASAFCATVVSAQSPKSGAPAARPEPPVTQLIVKFKDETPQSFSATTGAGRVSALSSEGGVAVGYKRPMSGLAHVYALPKAMGRVEAVALAKRLELSDASIEYAEPDVLLRAYSVPNDPVYGDYQWHYKAPNVASSLLGGINAPMAWDIVRGQGAVIAVLDTGITAHPDLDANVLSGYDFVSELARSNDGDGRDPDPSDPGDWVSAGYCGSGEPASDSSWHGTHVAGTIAAVTGNGMGVSGVAYEARVLAVRVLGRCGGTTSDIADAIRWAAGLPVPGVPNNTHVARVINMSLGGTGSCGPTFQDAVSAATAAGTLVVAATGNEYMPTIGTPANCVGALAVTAHTYQGDSADYANVGAGTGISAPGGGPCTMPDSVSFTCLTRNNVPNRWVWSTVNAGLTSPSGAGYSGTAWQGTSMATPHVAGVAALLVSKMPTLTVNELKFLLTSTARPFPAGTYCSGYTDGRCGSGMVDAKAALDRLADRVPLLVAQATPSVSKTDSPVALTALASARNGGSPAFTYEWTQTGGLGVVLQNANTATATFVRPVPGDTHTFAVRVTDLNGYSTTQTVTARTDAPPVIAAVSSQSVVSGNPLQFKVSATDPEGDSITYVATGLPTGATLDAKTGDFNWTAAGAPTLYPLTVAAFDGTFTSSTVVNITVTSPPAAASGSAANAPSGGGGPISPLVVALLSLAAIFASALPRRSFARKPARGNAMASSFE